MNPNHLAAWFFAQSWAMDPMYLNTFAAQVASAAQPLPLAAAPRSTTSRPASTAQGIARVGISGPITPKPDWLGGTSTAEIRAALMKALTDSSVGAILLDIDSPGGSVADTEELASEIYSARQRKPIIGLVNSLCASAAYWLGAQCTRLYSTPSGSTGSIGVYMAHANVAGALEKFGVEMTIISAGRYKTEGSPYRALDPEAKAFLQETIDAHHAAFINAVARGRGVSQAKVRKDFGEGRCFMAKDAAAAGMVDGIASATQLIGKMLTDGVGSVSGRNPFAASAAASFPTTTKLSRSLQQARTQSEIDKMAEDPAKAKRRREVERMQQEIELLRLQ